MFCFTFVSDHNTDSLMLYSVQLKNMYSYLNSSLKLSDIVCMVSPVNKRIATYYHYTNSSSSFPFILSYNFLLFPSTSCLVMSPPFRGSWNSYFLYIYSCTHANQTKRICPRFSMVIINTGQHMRFLYSSHRREAKAQLILRICANSSEPCAVHTITKEERKLSSLVLYIYVSKLTKCPRHNLILIYEDRPVSREAQTDLDEA